MLDPLKQALNVRCHYLPLMCGDPALDGTRRYTSPFLELACVLVPEQELDILHWNLPTGDLGNISVIQIHARHLCRATHGNARGGSVQCPHDVMLTDGL